MAAYGIEHYVDEDTFYIRQPHCSTSVRVREQIYRRTIIKPSGEHKRVIVKPFWDVEISADGDHWQNVYTLADKDSAIEACARLAEFIDREASKND